MAHDLESVLDALFESDWWDSTSWSTHRTTDGDAIVFTETEVYYVTPMGAISRSRKGEPERVILT